MSMTYGGLDEETIKDLLKGIRQATAFTNTFTNTTYAHKLTWTYCGNGLYKTNKDAFVYWLKDHDSHKCPKCRLRIPETIDNVNGWVFSVITDEWKMQHTCKAILAVTLW